MSVQVNHGILVDGFQTPDISYVNVDSASVTVVEHAVESYGLVQRTLIKAYAYKRSAAMRDDTCCYDVCEVFWRQKYSAQKQLSSPSQVIETHTGNM